MKHFLCSIALLCVCACQTSEPKVSTTLFDVRKSYKPYEEVLKKYTRSATVYSNYENLYVLNVAAFSFEFYEAFKASEQERFLSLNMLKDVNKNSTFFVSIFSPNFEYNDLSNEHLWEFVLKIDGKEYASNHVKNMKDKDAWYSFFPFTNRWSYDYIVGFDLPGAESLPEGTKIMLSLRNSQAKTEMNW